MADDPGSQVAGELSQVDRQDLLDGVDQAFVQVLHGRFGGGVDVTVQTADGAADPCVLRESRGPDQLSLILAAGADIAPQANGHALAIGSVRVRPPPGGTLDVTISTEIFDDHDPNEASDGSYFGGGVRLAPRSDHLPGGREAGGLAVVRCTEADEAASRHGARLQRGWLPRQARQSPGRALGLASNGHRRAAPLTVSRPVSADLLERIGGVVAGLAAASPPLSVTSVTLLVQTGADGLP